MYLKYKKIIISFLSIFLLSFFFLFTLLNNFIKEKEIHNVTVNYLFDTEFLIFLNNEEIKIRDAINYANKIGHNITEESWYFSNDGRYRLLNNLNLSINNQDLLSIAKFDNSKDLEEMDNTDIQSSILHSTKTIDKSLYKISFHYNFNNREAVLNFQKNINNVKSYIDSKLLFETHQVLIMNNNLLNDINEHSINLKNFCRNFKLTINNLNSKYMSNKLNIINRKYIEASQSFQNLCEDKNLLSFIPFIFTQFKKDNKSIKSNLVTIDYNVIGSSKNTSYNIMIFFISFSFTLFLLLIFIKLRFFKNNE